MGTCHVTHGRRGPAVDRGRHPHHGPDRTVGASSRNYRISANVQVIIDAATRLVVAAARSAPGNKADAQFWRNSGLAEHCEGVTVLGEGAYINTGLVVPHRKRPGRSLLPGEESDHAEHRRVRARVEHAFARMKRYKILRDCRQRGDGPPPRRPRCRPQAQPRPRCMTGTRQQPSSSCLIKTFCNALQHPFARMKTWKILRYGQLEGEGAHHAMSGIACLLNLVG
jgi:hypothetical protein